MTQETVPDAIPTSRHASEEADITAAALIRDRNWGAESLAAWRLLPSAAVVEALHVVSRQSDGWPDCLACIERLARLDRDAARRFALLLHRQARTEYWPAHFFVSMTDTIRPRSAGMRWLLAHFPEIVGPSAKLLIETDTSAAIPADIVATFYDAVANPNRAEPGEWEAWFVGRLFERIGDRFKAFAVLREGYRTSHGEACRFQSLLTMAGLARPLFGPLAELRLLVTALRVAPGHVAGEETANRIAALAATLPDVKQTVSPDEFASGEAALLRSDRQPDMAPWLQHWLEIPSLLDPSERVPDKALAGTRRTAQTRLLIAPEPFALPELPSAAGVADGTDPWLLAQSRRVMSLRRPKLTAETFGHAHVRPAGTYLHVFDRHGELLPEYSSAHASFFRFDALASRGIEKLAGHHFSLCVSFGHDNYSHFLLDRLPQLAFCKDWMTGAKLLVDEDALAWTQQVLDAVGSTSTLTAARRNTLYQVEELTLLSRPQHPIHLGYPGYIEFLRDIAARAGGTADLGPRLLVQRSKGRRGVENDEEFLLGMRERGFEVVYLEHHPIRDQLAMFRRAEMVVGVHGAGLSNLAACRPGTKVIEILPSDYSTPAFAIVSEAAGLRYWPYLEVSETNRSLATRGQFSDTFVSARWWTPFVDRVLSC